MDAPFDCCCNVVCSYDHQQEHQFFERDENNDFDVNTAPMTFRPVVKDAGTTIVRVKDVEQSPGTPREEWRSAIQSQTQSLCEHDVYPAVGEDEIGRAPSHKIIPGKSVFTIERENVKAQRMFEIAGCGNFHDNRHRSCCVLL